MGEISTIAKSLEEIKILYEYFEDSHRYIQTYNIKYDLTHTTSSSKLNRERSNSYKILITNLISGNLDEIDKFTTNVTHKIKQLRKFTLSEIAHSKSKKIEFEIDNPFIPKKLRRDYRLLKNDLFKLDENVLNCNIKDEKKIALGFENVIERLKNLEDEIEDEKKSSLFSTIMKFAVWGIPILIGLYQWIGTRSFAINSYIPLTVYVIILLIIYPLLKTVGESKFVYIHIKNNKRLLVPLMAAVSSPFVAMYVILGELLLGPNGGTILLLSALIVSMAYMILMTFFYLKSAIEDDKKKIIQNELSELAIKYGIEEETIPSIASHSHSNTICLRVE